eukprot:TRINITY_DN946_c0_g1_i2.p1 TRINITY_DN946_c0_g1~~TRINITY_DN946_c0_g1_i2.p1  ORF type:complete len:413 (-),score=80.64 TRINITY_DN946_c0_g1_i2:102-1340(-)
MASYHINFKNMGGNDEKSPPLPLLPAGNYQLARQSSVYSLTFDELQNTLGGHGKDFGSMNMDEFLKDIWTAEETQTQAMALASEAGGQTNGNVELQLQLQRQGSLTLPRTLSQKTVDQVWRDLYRESGNNGNSGSNWQQNFGEVTLEEFLVRAGVVREDDTQLATTSGFYSEMTTQFDSGPGLALGFQHHNGVVNNHQITENASLIPNQPVNIVNSTNGYGSSQQQQQQFFPKQPMVGYTSAVQLANNAEMANLGVRGAIMGIRDPRVHSGLNMVGLGGATAVTIATGSPADQLSSDGIGKSNGDISSLSPRPYMFNGGLRGRRCSGAVEKVVERRQRRMIKNRESAARSRARKQAYTIELEDEVAKLKEQNTDLQQKQAKILELHKIRVLEIINQQRGPKKQCLRRTQTGP